MKTSIKVRMNWHKIQQMEHTPESYELYQLTLEDNILYIFV